MVRYFGCLAAVFGFLSMSVGQAQAQTKFWVYVGTYSGKKSDGIYVAPFDAATGELGKATVAAKVTDPSFLAIHPTNKLLFCVCESNPKAGDEKIGVVSFQMDTKTGKLVQINGQPSIGAGPCHINCDRTGKFVLVANYGGGSTTVLPVAENGKLLPASDFVQHKGSSVNSSRQKEPHAHSVNLTADNRFAMVADLGIDKVLIYQFDAEKGKITASNPAALDMTPGDGPRHFAFHPTKPFAYVNNELTSSVTALKFDAKIGKLEKMGTLSTLPEPVKGNSTAEVAVHPSGKFVYVSNRGHNSIAIFHVDESSGELKAAGHQKAGIAVPRNFCIDPTGKWLFCANQAKDNVIVFANDPTTGGLKPTKMKIYMGTPVCIRFVPQS
ncbi:MAG: lactonase family protein [Zavarzinella sp.]